MAATEKKKNNKNNPKNQNPQNPAEGKGLVLGKRRGGGDVLRVVLMQSRGNGEGDTRRSLPSPWVVRAGRNTPAPLRAAPSPPITIPPIYISILGLHPGLLAKLTSLKQLASKNTFGAGKGRKLGFVYFYTKHCRVSGRGGGGGVVGKGSGFGKEPVGKRQRGGGWSRGICGSGKTGSKRCRD